MFRNQASNAVGSADGLGYFNSSIPVLFFFGRKKSGPSD
jgi:hypothetical protein